VGRGRLLERSGKLCGVVSPPISDPADFCWIRWFLCIPCHAML